MRRTIDRTNELREAIASTSSAPAPSRPTSPAARDTWVETATLTAGTLHQVSVFLRGIRQVYLSHSPKGKAPQQQRGDLDFSKGLLGVKASEWKFMSERERDEVDIQVKGILRATLAKIKQLESIEAQRQAKLKSAWTTTAATQAQQTQTAAHRQSIIYFLNHLLTDVGAQQSTLQEERFKRTSSSLSATPLPNTTTTASAKEYKPVISNDPPIESLLSQEQMQAFEDEAKQLTEQAQNQLSQIKSAETSLLEISALQSELVIHLTQQAEMTSKLWEDSLYVSGKVSDANKQLEKAKERNRESRVWLLVFLLGASFTLLFLDSY